MQGLLSLQAYSCGRQGFLQSKPFFNNLQMFGEACNWDLNTININGAATHILELVLIISFLLGYYIKKEDLWKWDLCIGNCTTVWLIVS